jgi:hypothetical protein
MILLEHAAPCSAFFDRYQKYCAVGWADDGDSATSGEIVIPAMGWRLGGDQRARQPWILLCWRWCSRKLDLPTAKVLGLLASSRTHMIWRAAAKMVLGQDSSGCPRGRMVREKLKTSCFSIYFQRDLQAGFAFDHNCSSGLHHHSSKGLLSYFHIHSPNQDLKSFRFQDVSFAEFDQMSCSIDGRRIQNRTENSPRTPGKSTDRSQIRGNIAPKSHKYSPMDSPMDFHSPRI